LARPEWFRFSSDVETFARNHLEILVDLRWQAGESAEQFAARVIQEQTILATARTIMSIPHECVAALNALEQCKKDERTKHGRPRS